MRAEEGVQQENEWELLYRAIVATLTECGAAKDPFGEGDYWLLDENWGWRQHQVEAQNLELFLPHVVEALRAVLLPYPRWSISMRVDVIGKEKEWPGMGIIIFHDEVVDELKREFLPAVFRDIKYTCSA